MITSKWKRIVLMGMVMGSCFVAGAYAEDAIQRVDAYLRHDFKVIVNGGRVALDNTPLIYNDSSYLPVKELAGYLGAKVEWDGATQSIYINSIVNPGHIQGGTQSTYEEIKLSSPYVVTLHYLGAEYPVLMNMTDKIYYRHKDILAMQINTSGLTKVKERFTEELYISEDELKKSWKETPQTGYLMDPIAVYGEKDTKKLEAIRNYVELHKTQPFFNPSHPTTPEYRFIQPILVEPLDKENTYSYLFIDNQHYYRMTLTLGKNLVNESYGVSSSSTENIEAKIK
jgi:hypothetical protein